MPEALLLIVLDDFADKLEAGQHVVHDDSVRAADFRRQLGGHNGLDGEGVIRHGAGFLICSQDIFQKQAAHLIAGDGGKAAVTRPGDHAHAVGVRIGRNDKIRSHAVGDADAKLKRRPILRVGLFDCREIPVDDHLLRHGEQVPQTDPAQDFRHKPIPRTVQGRIHDLEVVRHVPHRARVDRLLFHFGKVRLVDVAPQQGDLSGAQRLSEIDRMDVRENVQAFHDRCDHIRVLRRELCAVLPVRLIAVVLARIMRGGDVDARDAVQVAQGKRQLRRRAQFVKQVDRDIRRRQHGSRRPGELLRVVTAVIGDDHAGGGFALAADQLCQRLRCVGDCMGIHGVHACFHDAAQSGSAEGQIVCEAQAQFVIVVLNGEEFCLLVCRQAVGCQPAVVLFHVFFHTVFLSGCYFGFFGGEGGARRFWSPVYFLL